MKEGAMDSTKRGKAGVREILAFAQGYLQQKGIDSAEIDAKVLFCHIYGMDTTRFLMALSEEINIDERYKKFTALVNTRGKGTPVAYLTGEKEFYSLPFYVNETVLIPRPDTETLVRAVLDFLRAKNRGKAASILEIGVGSGCCSVAVAKNYKQAHIFATDINVGVLAVAAKNAIRNGVDKRVWLVLSDLFGNTDEKFDVIMSNPPYIPSGDVENLSKDVRDYEPIIALDGGADGLDFYRKIAAGAKERLIAGGGLFVEVGAGQSKQVVAIFEENGLGKIKINKDLSGIERVIIATA